MQTLYECICVVYCVGNFNFYTFTLFVLYCYMTLSEIVSQTFASCSSDTGMMAELWKREHFCYCVMAPNGNERYEFVHC